MLREISEEFPEGIVVNLIEGIPDKSVSGVCSVYVEKILEGIFGGFWSGGILVEFIGGILWQIPERNFGGFNKVYL